MRSSCISRSVAGIAPHSMAMMRTSTPSQSSSGTRSSAASRGLGVAPAPAVDQIVGPFDDDHSLDLQRGWPISEHAMRDILSCLERLDTTDRRVVDQRRAALQRAHRIRRQLPHLSVASDPSAAAVGRRVRVSTEFGQDRAWWLALPGDEEATAETVAITSPIGRALAWARPGHAVFIPGPRGAWAVVLDVSGSR